jgi:hypothetical protein
MGNYQPILMQIGTQTKKNMLSLKITIPEVEAKFQDGRRRLLEIQVRVIKRAFTTRF